MARSAGATGDEWIHEYFAVSCVAILIDVTIVDRPFSFHDPSLLASMETTNKAKGANCARHDTLLKLLVMTEREQSHCYHPLWWPMTAIMSRVSDKKVRLIADLVLNVIGILVLLSLYNDRIRGTRVNNGMFNLRVNVLVLLWLKRQQWPLGNLVGANYDTPLIKFRTGMPIPLPWHTLTFPSVLVNVIRRGAEITTVLATPSVRKSARRTLSAFGGALTTKQLKLF